MISDEDLTLLSAYIDSELDSADMNAVRERLLKEPGLKAALEEMQEVDQLVKAHADQMDDRAVPENVASLLAASEESQSRFVAMAASVLLVLAGGLFFLVLDSGAPLAELDVAESGKRTTTESGYLEVVATFHHRDGHVCREYRTETERSIACRDGSSWNVVVSVPSADVPEGTYQPAAGSDLAAIDEYISEHIQGEVLSSAEERELIESDWR